MFISVQRAKQAIFITMLDDGNGERIKISFSRSDSLAMVSFMWTWTGLKENATAHAWDDVVDKVDAAANDTYTELQDLADEQKFKVRQIYISKPHLP